MIPLNKTSDNLVLDLILANNTDAEIDFTKVKFGEPEINTDEGATKNTKLKITARKNSGFINSQDVVYNRLRGEGLFRNITAYLDVNLPKSTDDLLAKLNKQYGLNIQPEDIVAAQIEGEVNPIATDPEADDPEPVPHTLTFAPDCMAFLGTINLLIGPRPQVGERLSLVITQTDLDGLHYPDGPSDTKGQAYIYSYGTDCTAISNFLSKRVAAEDLDDTAFATELNKVFPEEWTATAPEIASAPYNLRDAEITYAGPTVKQVPDQAGTGTVDEPIPGVNSTDYNSVVIVKLSDKCDNFTGELILHYNA